MEREDSLKITNENAAVLAFDQDGRIFQASSSIEQVIGYRPGEMIGRLLAEFLLDPEEIEKVLRAIREAIVQGCVASEEFRFRHKDQKDFFAEMILVPLCVIAADGIGCQCLLRNVTRYRETDKRIEEAHAMRAQFTDTVSHELRTPLSVTGEVVSMLLAGEAGPINEKQKQFLEIARTNVERLGKLIEETLDLKALEDGRKALHIRENSLGEIFAAIEKMKKDAVEKKGFRLVIQVDPKLPRINFDRERILECFGILVDFSVRDSGKGDVLVSGARENNELHLWVRSPASEKPCEDLSKLFLRFEPLNEAEKVKMGRTGVEFARAKEIVEKHRGKIWAEFLPHEGMFLHILLPIWERRVWQE